MSTFKKCTAEFIGTAVLVLFGCGTAAVTGCTTSGNAAYLITALAFGLAIVAMAYSIGNISGCHINPAVSFAMLILGKMKAKEFFAYIAAQFLGGIAGAGILSLLIDKEIYGLGANGLYDRSAFKSLIVEIILTFVFVIAVIGVTSKSEFSRPAGLVIGLSLTLVHILGIFFTGTSVNPARSFGPALFMLGSQIRNVWVFIVAPLIGAGLAAVVYKALSPRAVVDKGIVHKKKKK